MTASLVPFRPSRLPRATQQALDHQQQLALVKAKSVQTVGFVAEVAMFTVAGLSNLEGELVKQVPLAEPRLNAIVNTATAVIGGQLARLAQELG
jgi:hypothetical protein